MRVHAIVAHPDDEVLGPGGTLIRHARAGDEVSILILGEGMTSRGEADEKLTEAVAALRRSARAAAEVMGVTRLQLGDFPDNRFDTVALLDLVKAVERFEAPAEIVYTHHPGDLNVDHRLTSQAVMTAYRPLPGAGPIEIYFFETPSSTEWHSFDRSRAFIPNVFVDVSATLERKIEAFGHYATEAADYPHPRSAEGLRIAARERGLRVGLEAAEAFRLARRIVR